MTLTDWRLPFDEPVFHAVNSIGVGWLDAAFVAASSHPFGLACFLAMTVWLIVEFRKRALVPAVQLGLTVLLVDRIGAGLIKPWVGRMRPSFALAADSVRVVAPASNSGSMPSLHSSNAFAVAVVMALLVPKTRWVTFPIAAFIAVSRLGCGVHWPSDIMAGAVFGSCIAVAVVLPSRKLTRGWKYAPQEKLVVPRPDAPPAPELPPASTVAASVPAPEAKVEAPKS